MTRRVEQEPNVVPRSGWGKKAVGCFYAREQRDPGNFERALWIGPGSVITTIKAYQASRNWPGQLERESWGILHQNRTAVGVKE